jgi:hypothetical protein
MSLTRPKFESSVPEYLLKDATEKDKFIIEQLSIIGQQSNWVIDETIKQSEKLESVDTKVSYTNGKVGAAILQIKALEDKNTADREQEEQVRQIVKTKKFIEKFIYNKTFWIGFAVFVFFGVKTGFFEGVIRWIFTSIGLS